VTGVEQFFLGIAQYIGYVHCGTEREGESGDAGDWSRELASKLEV